MIVWMDSCQRLRTDALASQRYGTASAAWTATGGRNNGPRITVGVGFYAALVVPLHPPPSGSTFLLGCRLCSKPNTYPGWVGPTWEGAAQVGLEIAADGTLSIRVGPTGTVLASAYAAYDGEVRYLSFEMGVDASAGYTRVYLDGVAIDYLCLDDLDTRPQVGGLWDGFYVGGSWGPSFCDLLVADGTDPSGAGHDLHDIWMDARVDYLPVNGNGYSSEFVGEDADSVNNFAQVDETSPDDDTTYVESGVPAIDGYAKAACPAGTATVLGAAVYARGKKTDAGVAAAKVGLRSGSTNEMSDAQALAVHYADAYLHVGHDPDDGAAFTPSSFDAMEVVVEKA